MAVTVYRALDGSIHETEEKADRHDLEKQVKDLFENNTLDYREFDLEGFCQDLRKKQGVAEKLIVLIREALEEGKS